MATRAPDTLEPARTWADRAACAGDDPDRYFSDRTPIRQLPCARCPVADPCLAEALAAEGTTAASMRFGVFGGLNADQRAELALKRAKSPRLGEATPIRGFPNGPSPTEPCGTRAAYRRHQRHGETPCGACRAAESRKRSERAARRSAA